MIESSKLSTGYHVRSVGNYQESVEEFATHNVKPADVAMVAEHRIDLGIYHEISWTGTRTTDLFVYKNGRYFLAHGNVDAIHEDASSFRWHHEDREEIPYSEDYINGNMMEVTEERMNIPVQELTEDATARFLLGDHTSGYTNWLTEAGIPVLPLFLPNYSLVSGHKDFIRPLIIRCTDNWSGIITTHGDLHLPYGYRGYSEKMVGGITEEVFHSTQLDVFRKFVPIENRSHTLSELKNVMRNTPYASLLNPLLRFVRNGEASNLPANYDVFLNRN